MLVPWGIIPWGRHIIPPGGIPIMPYSMPVIPPGGMPIIRPGGIPIIKYGTPVVPCGIIIGGDHVPGGITACIPIAGGTTMANREVGGLFRISGDPTILAKKPLVYEMTVAMISWTRSLSLSSVLVFFRFLSETLPL